MMKLTEFKSSLDYDNLENGLKERGFIGIEGIDSIGSCHKNKKHYILRTDGLIIYSNFWDTHDVKPPYYKKYWDMSDFNFSELDDIITNHE